MGWIAGKRQRVKRNGEYVWVNPGDPLPEAEHWPNRSSWERQGYIRQVKRGALVEAVKVETRRTNAFTKKRRSKPKAKPKVEKVEKKELKEAKPKPKAKKTKSEKKED
jgi:hypothetical protein